MNSENNASVHIHLRSISRERGGPLYETPHSSLTHLNPSIIRGPRYVPAISKGFLEACEKGPLTGSPVERVRMTLLDGAEHSVDSSEMAFKAAGMGAMREAVLRASPQVMQPIMKVEIVVPDEYQVRRVA